MARAALDWSVRDLAGRAQVHRNTISRIESGAEAEPRTLATLRAVLERAGVEFIEDKGRGPGVRMVKVDWRRTQDGDLPPNRVEVLISYTVGAHKTQMAIFDRDRRIWTLSIGHEVAEADVPMWAPGPYDMREGEWPVPAED